MTERDTSGFARASHQSQALCLATLGTAGLLMPIAVWGFPSVPRFTVGMIGAAAGVWLWFRARRHWRMHGAALADYSDGSLGLEMVAGGSGDALVAAAPDLYVQGQLHPDVVRLLRVAASKFPGKLVLDTDATELEDDGKGGRKLVSWGFRCVESGFLTDASAYERMQTTFRKALGGIWSPVVDTRNDTFGGTRKSSIPKLVFPPIWPVVRDAEEAKKRYTGWEYKLGVSADGEVGVCIEAMPQAKVIGETGAGKSVAVRSWLEQFRAMGWMLVLADGKGADYAGYIARNADDHGFPVPGTVAAGLGSSPRGMGYVAAVALVYQIMQERQEGSHQGKIDDPENWNSFVPVLLVMDEIKAMREKWRNNLSKEEARSVESMVTEITGLGRELRVHCLLISQDARDSSIPGVWTSNLPVTISLGKPSDMTMNKGFEDSVAPKVRLIRESMDPKVKGRCLIATVHPKTGAADALEYQGYLGYSPGEHANNPKLPAQARTEWPKFKEQVSDQVPRLYTRQWFKIDEKSEAQLAAEAKGAPDLGFIDFDLFSVDEIKRLDRVALDMRDESGTIVPDPAVAKYDPSSKEYVCRPPLSTRKVIKAEL